MLSRGYDQTKLDVGRHPYREELDRAAPNNPVMLVRTCGHVAICNSQALKLGGIDEMSPTPQGGLIEQQNGRLTGLLAENARAPVQAAIPPATEEDIIAGIERGGQYLLSLGITSCMDAAVGQKGGFREIAAYHRAKRDGRLPVRTWLTLLGDDGRSIVPECHAAGLISGTGDEMLMIGGVYLSFEGTEKLVEFFVPHAEEHEERKGGTAREIEDSTVKGAIRTDFILSAEIIAMTLASLDPTSLYIQAVILAAVGIVITFAVYGVVGIIVKLDDMGVSLVRNSHSTFGQQFGRGLVAAMPLLLKILSTAGTVAMLWVGGSIVVHGLASLGMHGVESFIHAAVSRLPAGESVPAAVLRWIATSFLQAVLAVLIGLVAVAALHLGKSLFNRRSG